MRKPHVAGKSARGIHAALSQEAFDIAMLVAVTGSIVNSVASSKRPQLRVAMAAYVPAAPSIFPVAVTTGAAAATLPTATIQSMIGLYALVAFARSATEGHALRREAGSAAGPISVETLAEAWQAAAMQSIGVLTMLGYLDKKSHLFSDGKDNTAALRLVEMLWGVTLGRSPCVRIDGAVIVPGWIERRTHLRREVNTPATLSVNGREMPVTVRDLSAGGLGIDGGASIKVGDQVTVSLGSGAAFEGVAVWNRDGRVGVKLSAPIASLAGDN